MGHSNETRSKYLSVIVPIYNEEESIPFLYERIRQALEHEHFSYEVIYVDDGSADGTFAQLKKVTKSDEHVRVIRLRRNFGQTAAMAAGVAHSEGEIIVFMDGDLQNDPLDIAQLLTKLEEGYDVVSGWRKDRQDAQLSRKLPSMLANKLISKVTGVHLHDYGCTLKAYRYEVLRHVHLYGEMHRFIPAYAALAGAAITEIEVTHHARQFGRSKYGISRVVRVLLDLTTLKFLGSFGTKPLYAFGNIGLTSLALGATSSAYTLSRRIARPQRPTQHSALLPLLLSGFGLLSIMLGVLAEVLMRTYYESQHKAIYVVRQQLPYQALASSRDNEKSNGLNESKAQRNGTPDTIAR